MLGACTTQIPANNESVDVLIEEGILAYFDVEEIEPPEFRLIPVTRHIQDIHWTIPVLTEFPRQYHLRFDVELPGTAAGMEPLAFYHAYFSGMGNIRAGTQLQEGDFIAELTYTIPPTIVIAQHALGLEIQQFEDSFQRDRQARLIEMENLRQEIEFADEGEWEILTLRLQRAELAYQQFIITSNIRRQQFADRMETITAPVTTERMYSPVTGRVTITTQSFNPMPFRLVASIGGTAGGVPTARRILSIVDESYMHMFVSSGLDIFRYGDIISISRMAGVSHFYAMVASDPLTANVRREGSHRIRIVPLEGELERFVYEEEGITDHIEAMQWLASVSLRAHPTTPFVTDSIAIDQRLVMEESGRNFVLTYEDGTIGRRYIVLGKSFAGHVQVLVGLEEGQYMVWQGSDAAGWVDAPTL